jgi:hypothetical protein
MSCSHNMNLNRKSIHIKYSFGGNISLGIWAPLELSYLRKNGSFPKLSKFMNYPNIGIKIICLNIGFKALTTNFYTMVNQAQVLPHFAQVLLRPGWRQVVVQ